MKKTILLGIILLYLSACELGDINELKEDSSSDNSSLTTFYISPSGDNDADGSSAHPWKTI